MNAILQSIYRHSKAKCFKAFNLLSLGFLMIFVTARLVYVHLNIFHPFRLGYSGQSNFFRFYFIKQLILLQDSSILLMVRRLLLQITVSLIFIGFFSWLSATLLCLSSCLSKCLRLSLMGRAPFVLLQHTCQIFQRKITSQLRLIPIDLLGIDSSRKTFETYPFACIDFLAFTSLSGTSDGQYCSLYEAKILTTSICLASQLTKKLVFMLLTFQTEIDKIDNFNLSL